MKSFNPDFQYPKILFPTFPSAPELHHLTAAVFHATALPVVAIHATALGLFQIQRVNSLSVLGVFVSQNLNQYEDLKIYIAHY